MVQLRARGTILHKSCQLQAAATFFFWRTLWFWDENRNFVDRFQLKTFFFFREHPDFETKISVFSRLRRANSNNFEKWPTRVKKLDHPDLDFIFAAREAFLNLNAALHALSLGPHCSKALKYSDFSLTAT